MTSGFYYHNVRDFHWRQVETSSQQPHPGFFPSLPATCRWWWSFPGWETSVQQGKHPKWLVQPILLGIQHWQPDFSGGTGVSGTSGWLKCHRVPTSCVGSWITHPIPHPRQSTSQVGVYPTETQPDSQWSDSSGHREVSDLWGGESLAGNICQRPIGNGRGWRLELL